VLGGLGLSKDKEKEAESSEGKTSNPEKRQEGEQEKNPEQEKSPEQEKNPKTEEGTTDQPKEHGPEMEVKTQTRLKLRIQRKGQRRRPSILRRSRTHSSHQERWRSKLGNQSPLSPPCSRHREMLARDGYLVKN
jgi:hypothetical protein